MADFAPEGVTSIGTVSTERSGAAISTDTVPDGALIVARNTGAGVHTIVLVNEATWDNLLVPNRTISITNGTVKVFRVTPGMGGSDYKVNMYIGEGTQTEIKYYVIGA